MNITGTWKYTEEFDYGSSEGIVELKQEANMVNGIFTFIEEVKNDYKINVVEKVKGTISDGRVILRSVEVTATQDGQKISYLPNNFELHLVSENKLVGSTYDSEDVCGVFTLERTSNQTE